MKLTASLREFFSWLGQVLRKWWVWLGFLPLLLDLVSAYIPTDYIPPQIYNLLEAGANWQLTLVLVTIGTLISAFLVHLETETRLAAYEYQAPEYELKTNEVTSDFCRSGCHVRVRCHLSIKGINPFKGELEYITVSSGSQTRGLGPWEIDRTWYGRAQSSLPVTVSHSECDLVVEAHAEIEESPELSRRQEWENAEFMLQLVIEYFTQPVGYTRKLLPVNIQVDLGEQFDTLASSRTEKGG